MFKLPILANALAAVLLNPPPTTGTRIPIPEPRNNATAQEIIDALGLIPNVEGGYYLETFRDPFLVPLPGSNDCSSNRSVSTAIYYLLEGSAGFSRWHRVVDAAEVWHWYAGAPLSLYLWREGDGGDEVRERVLGSDVLGASGAGGQPQSPQVVVARAEWQRARSWGEWSLVGTTVAPAFTETGFELAPPGWEPHGA
ncbi:hypothetical protein DL769_005509 [Monosporascus sp. CRB-8-3]|nr:hypothetical protein DL769_005509 [Monosporascus sp. CRB-8-3]